LAPLDCLNPQRKAGQNDKKGLLLRHEGWRRRRTRLGRYITAAGAPPTHDVLPGSASAEPAMLRHVHVVVTQVKLVAVDDASGIGPVAVPVAKDDLPRGAGAKEEVLRRGHIVVGEPDLVVVDRANGGPSIAVPIAKDDSPRSTRAEPEVLRHVHVVVGE